MHRTCNALLSACALSSATFACSSTRPNAFNDAGAPEPTTDGGTLVDSTVAAEAGPDAAPVTPPSSVSIDPQGNYTITFQQPSWTFRGTLGTAPTGVQNGSGTDKLGPYHEVTFAYSDTSAKTADIRAYDAAPVVLFTVTYVAAATNTAPFPSFTSYPQVPYHLTYSESQFAPFSFSALTPDSPWVYFDANANAFILSAASHFMNAATSQTGGAIASGIDPTITTLPAGFSQQTILVAEPGINAAYASWGQALTAWSGKTMAASDATPELARFGYWTDNGASYYYAFDASKGYTGTLLAVRDYFQQQGIPLAYMQIDSWWYPKGPAKDWTDKMDGQYTYTADATLFPSDLPAFQSVLGLPLITHARWIDKSSPYRSMYTMSNDVSTDPAYWKTIAAYLAGAGVTTYEQDWLNHNALPATNNLTDQDAFMDGMANAMSGKGLAMQYCMPLPRHYLQSTKYPNLVTTRVSDDRFSQPRWHEFFYGSRLASALGEWPWVDVFMSSEEENLLLATLSGGMVGVGDAIGAASKANILKSIRADGVIVKPDAPIVPLDATFLHDAQAMDTPFVGATFTDFGGLRASYVFAYNNGQSISATFTPSELGYSGSVFVWNYFQATGKLVDSATPYTENLVNGRAYYVVVPVGASGIAFLGDAGKYVALGKKRITQLADNGTLSIGVAFAAGESTVTLHGYAPRQPVVSESAGSVGPIAYDGATKMFSLTVSGASGAAALTLK